MSILNTSVTKQPLKLIEVPLNKFSEEVIPHHQNIFEQHKTLVLKLISQNNGQRVRQEVKNKKRIVKQLKDLMYELDTLRAQVEDSDLDKFDTKTLSFRKIIITLISGYTDLEKRSLALDNQNQDDEDEKRLLRERCPFEGASQIQLQDNLEDIKLRQRQELLNEVETVQRDTEDLNQIFTHLNQMVEGQREQVEHVEETIEESKENVQSGFKQLVKAHKLKTAVYPVTGAFLGSMIGGPVGLVAGFKIGGLTALGCAIAGYTGGKFFKKNHEVEEIEEKKEESVQMDDKHEKKDI
ncbi:syntaxin-17 [Tribolium castaneum]|uniref:Syntaxin-17-like Protein n=1 Tax=Tribolium castaneum TaxID=7070 RepID=D6WIQ1_TRICA|nr:Syntaxin-17-like Protein [Tribolium castaneum]